MRAQTGIISTMTCQPPRPGLRLERGPSGKRRWMAPRHETPSQHAARARQRLAAQAHTTLLPAEPPVTATDGNPGPWYHGTLTPLADGGTLLPAGHPDHPTGGHYAVTDGSPTVFVTDRPEEAHQWAQFAAEMEGLERPRIRVYEVRPLTAPAPKPDPETHSDGTPYSEYTAEAAVVVCEVTLPRPLRLR